MTMKPLSPQELRVWHAFRLMHEDVPARVGRDIAQATGLSGPEFGVLSRLPGPRFPFWCGRVSEGKSHAEFHTSCSLCRDGSSNR
jgi:hypothetical protein